MVDIQRIHNSIYYRWGRADGASLAAALNSQWVVRRLSVDELCVEGRQVVSAGHAIVHEGSSQELPFLIVNSVFQQCLADALRDPSVHLTMDNHWVDHGAKIVHRDKIQDVCGAGFGIYLHFAYVATGGKGEIRWIKKCISL